MRKNNTESVKSSKDELFNINKEASIYYPSQSVSHSRYDPKYKVTAIASGSKRIPNSDKLRSHRSLKY